MGRNGVSMEKVFTAKVNRIKITLDDHPETDRATHSKKTAVVLQLIKECFAYILLYIEAITFHCTIWQSTTYGNPVR